MNPNLAKAISARTRRRQPDPDPQRMPPASNTIASSHSAQLQAGIGNSAIANQSLDRSSLAFTTDFNDVQSSYGNRAVGQAAIGFEFDFEFSTVEVEPVETALGPDEVSEIEEVVDEELLTDEDEAAEATSEATESGAVQQPDSAQQPKSEAVQATEKAGPEQPEEVSDEEGESEKGEAESETGTEGPAEEETAPGEAGAGKPAPAAEGGAAVQDAPELTAWRSKVAALTGGIRQPPMDEPAAVSGRVRATGVAATGRATAARQSVPSAARAVIPPPPKPPDPLPLPSEDPVPEATQLVRNASDKLLPNQPLPILVVTPRGTVPTVSRNLAADSSTKVAECNSCRECSACRSGPRASRRETRECTRRGNSSRSSHDSRDRRSRGRWRVAGARRRGSSRTRPDDS